MSKFKKGQKVWVCRYSHWLNCLVCEEMVFESYSLNGNFVHVKDRDLMPLSYDTPHVFKTKQECLDYITNNIQIITL